MTNLPDLVTSSHLPSVNLLKDRSSNLQPFLFRLPLFKIHRIGSQKAGLFKIMYETTLQSDHPEP